MKSPWMAAAAALGLGLAASAQAGHTGLAWIDSNTNLTFYADARIRYELDWDSHNSAGVARDDRHRGRIRARFGFDYGLTEDWSIGSRVRTGNSHSQQSPHLTFATDDGARDELDFVVDRYFLQYKHGAWSGWAGRNLTPFWQQNELFWDEDVTPTGLALSYNTSLGKGKVTGTMGAFYLPDGGFDLNGRMVAGQVKYTLPAKTSQWTFAGGFHYLNGESGASFLLNRNGDRDYLIGVGGIQWSIPVQGVPLTLGADVFRNFKDYDAAELAPYSAAHKDQKLGYVFSAALGQLKKQNDWLIGYYYCHIETFAVNGSYAQDDWIRFGNGAQTDASNFEGHEIRLAYALSKNLNLVARLYLVNAIVSAQDGKRFRVDLNWKW